MTNEDVRDMRDEWVEALATDPWQRLAHAIIWQAAEDYRMLENEEDLEEIEAFFRSEWFEILTTAEPEEIISGLRAEKKKTEEY